MKRIFKLLVIGILVTTTLSVIANTHETKTVSTLKNTLHLPQTTQVAAEGQNLIVFTNVDSCYDNGMDAVTLWVYRPKSGKLIKLLTTNPNGNYECLGYGDKAQKVSLTSIPTINSVHINAEEDKILVEGYDDRNSYTYIISLTKGLPTIQLPCNAGIYGMSSEEDLPIGQSYVYYKKGGRYNVISVFDWNGNCLKYTNLKKLRQKNKSKVQLYKQQLEQCFDKIADKEGRGYCTYFLADMNNDDMPELFVKYGHCEADFKLNVYTIREERVHLIYKATAGHRDFQQGSTYVIMVEAQSGAYYSCKLLMKNGKIEEEPLVCKDASIPIAEFDYPEYSEPQIEFYDYTNVQPIKDAFDVLNF